MNDFNGLAMGSMHNIGEISGGDLTARSLDHRELLLISCLTHGVHARFVTHVSGRNSMDHERIDAGVGRQSTKKSRN